MKILNFDTSLDKTYITLSNNGEILESFIVENQENKYHSAFLIPTIAKILRVNNLQATDIDYLATNPGPGSFTGIRAGLVVARTLCQQANIKALGVSSLKILSKINTTAKNSLIMLDARKNMSYTAVFNTSGETVEEETAMDNNLLLEKIKNGNYFVICDEKSAQTLSENNIEYTNYKDKNYDLGKFLNEITTDFIHKNPNYDYNWARLRPLYIQPPPVSQKSGTSQ